MFVFINIPTIAGYVEKIFDVSEFRGGSRRFFFIERGIPFNFVATST